jgi:hypothetical protein
MKLMGYKSPFYIKLQSQVNLSAFFAVNNCVELCGVRLAIVQKKNAVTGELRASLEK